MEQQYNSNFFERYNYEKIISEQFSDLENDDCQVVKHTIMEISKINDVFIQIYLLDYINPMCKFIDDEVLKIFKKILYDYEKEKYKVYDVKACIKKFFVKNLNKNVTIEAFVENISNLNLDENQIQTMRNFFGFSKIYKYFTNRIENLTSAPLTKDEAFLIFQLLNKDESAISVLSDVFEKVKRDIENNKTDDSFIHRINIIEAVVSYNIDTFYDHLPNIPSLVKSIIHKHSNPENIGLTKYITVNKLGEIIGTLLTNTYSKNKMEYKRLKIHQKAYEDVIKYIENETTVYEEIISMGFLLEVIYQFNHVTLKIIVKGYNFKDIAEILGNFQIKKPFGITDNDFSLLVNNFTIKKYKVLDSIINEIDDYELNTVSFNKDMSNVKDFQEFFLYIKNFWNYIEWDSIIHIGCQKENLKDFASVITNERSMKSKNHLHYIYMYILALKRNKYHSLILLTINNVIEYYKTNNIDEDQLNFFIIIYLMDIKKSIKNNCIMKKRKHMLNFFYHNVPNELSNRMLIEILNEVYSHNRTSLNNNILLLILLCARKSKDIDRSILNRTSAYIIQLIALEYKKHSKITDDLNMYIAVLVTILDYHHKDISFTPNDYNHNTETFIKIVVALLCCIFTKPVEKYLLIVKYHLLNYLFKASLVQKNLIGSLLKQVDSTIRCDRNDHEKLVSLCEFLMEKLLVII